MQIGFGENGASFAELGSATSRRRVAQGDLRRVGGREGPMMTRKHALFKHMGDLTTPWNNRVVCAFASCAVIDGAFLMS